MRIHARSRRIALVAVLALALLAIAAPAAFAGSGSIEGTVTAALDSTPLENIAVKAIPAMYASEADAEAHGHGIPAVLTGVDGKFVIPMVPDGAYYVKFYDPTRTPLAWATQWFDGAYDWPYLPMDADAVLVLPNLRTSDVNAAMLPSSTISGTVFDADTNPFATIAGIQVIPWYEGCGISWEALMTAVETGRHHGGAMEADTDARHPHLPDWVEDHMTWTGSQGAYEIGPVEPANYRLYFHDPDGEFAPTALSFEVVPGQDYVADAYMHDAGWLYGWVDGDLGNDTEYPLEGVKVWVYADYGFPYVPPITHAGAAGKVNGGFGILVATTRTDENGRYEVNGLPAGEYRVVFDADGYNHFDATSELGKSHRDLYYSFERFAIIHEDEGTELCALLVPMTWAHFVHPPFGVNDGPDRYNTAVSVYGWGMFFAFDFHFELWNATHTTLIHTIRPHTVEYVSPYEVVLHMNIASPLAPVGTYELDYAWANWQYKDGEDTIFDAFQVVNSYVPVTPITPPAPAVTPSLPATPTPIENPPVVTPPPTPDPEPVAGAVTVAASAASVKYGKMATLKFQVNESVLGGTADVKVVISDKAGRVVKQVKASVKMNAAASISFRCKLAKGTYSYTVSAGSASATSKLIVK